MSQEKVLEALGGLGLEKLDAHVYIFLSKRGSQKAKEIVKALKISRQHLYEILKTLQKKGLVSATLEHPARFSVISFEKALDLFVKAKMEEAQRLRRDKAEIVSNWKEMSVAETADQSPRFTVIEGRKHIYPRLTQMIEETKKQLSIISTVSGLVRAEQFGIIDVALKRASKTNTKFRFLTELTEENLKAVIFLLERMSKARSIFEVRSPELGSKLFSRMIIKDDVEIAFFVNKETGDAPAIETDDVCLWINSKTLVNSFSAMFEDLWSNSTDIEKKIIEIETGKPTPKTCVITEAETAKNKYDETLRSAKKEIVIMTSSKGLLAMGKNMPLLEELTNRGVSIRIMASIVNENLEAAQQLKKLCEVRHVPDVYLGTTTVDGQHFFQFKNPPSDEEDMESLDCFENTFYTNDAEYVRKTVRMLDGIWNNAQVPSPIALRAIIQQPLPSSKPAGIDIFEEHKKELKKIAGFSYTMEPQQGTITEKEVVDKIANAVRVPAKDPKRDIVRIYGTQANAVIYPPKNLNLPNFLIIVFNNNRKSSFGAENAMQLYTQMKIAEHESYLLVAFVTDNPQGYKFRKAMEKVRQLMRLPTF